MARINVENGLWGDKRFVDLCIKMQDADKALGGLVRAWMLAQKWYLRPDKGIPDTEWKKQGIPEAIIEVGLAKRSGDFVFVLGADEQFAWLTQRVEAGRKGGIAKRENHNTITESSDNSEGLATAKRPLSDAKPPISLLLSPSSFLPSHNSKDLKPCQKKISDTGQDLKKLEAGKNAQLLIQHYCEEYKKRHRGTPAIHGKTVGLVTSILKSVSLEKAKDMVTVFFQIKDPWFQKTKHRFDVFYQNFEQIGAALDAGKPLQDTTSLDEWFAEMKSKEHGHDAR